jgi:hypothetical protein
MGTPLVCERGEHRGPTYGDAEDNMKALFMLPATPPES